MSIDNLTSIIMPTYNCGHLISRAINSVISQSFSDWELIIIDNNSNDNTREIIKNFRDKRIKYCQINNRGIIAVSRNKGIEIAKGVWIAFLDADDWWTSDKLLISINTLKKGYDFVYHDLYKFYENKINLSQRKVTTKQLDKPIFKSLLENGNMISNSSVVLRSSILRKIGGLSEDRSLVAAEDFDCWLRFAKETERFKRIKSCHGFYWIGINNTSSLKKTIVSLESIIKKHYDKLDLTEKNNINVSKLIYSIIKSHYILKNYNMAKDYFKILEQFPIKTSLRFKLILIRVYGYISVFSK